MKADWWRDSINAWRDAARQDRWLVAGGVATAALCAVFFLRMNVLERLPYWFWPLHQTSLPYAWILLPVMILATVLTARRLFNSHAQVGRNTALLIILMFGLQMGWVLMEGEGIAPLRERLLTSGHSGFVRQAVVDPHIGSSFQEYSQRWLTGDMVDSYPMSTKPPGQLAVYQVMAEVSQWQVLPLGKTAEERLVTLAAWFLPLLASLVVIPLTGISRRFFAEGMVYLPALLMAVTPAFNLVQVHLDQALYPLLATLPVWIGLKGWQEKRWGWLVVAGGLVYLAGLISFSLWASGVLLAGILTLLALGRMEKRWTKLAAAGGFLAVGFGAAFAAVWVSSDYNAWTAFRLAVANHAEWKVTNWPWYAVVYSGFLNGLEWLVWTGPLAGSMVLSGIRCALRRGEEMTAARATAIALGGTMIWLAFGAETMAETARLWLFFLPPACLVIAGEVKHLFAGRWKYGWTGLMIVQMLVTLVFKALQDF